MKKILSICLLVFCAGSTYGQENKNKGYNNNIKIELGTMEAGDWGFTSSFPILKQIGIYYDRRIYKNLCIGVGYNQWSLFGSRPFWSDGPSIINPESISNPFGIHTGTIESRNNYKMFDVYGLYKYGFKGERHFVSAGMGVFYSTGMNYIVEHVSINPEPYGDAEIILVEENVSYWGVLPQLRYDYTLFNGRVNLGMHYKVRTFLKTDYTQYDIGLHIGFNF